MTNRIWISFAGGPAGGTQREETPAQAKLPQDCPGGRYSAAVDGVRTFTASGP